jgi:hypothetical protein
MPAGSNYAEQAAIVWNLDKLHLDLATAKANIPPMLLWTYQLQCSK